MRCHDSDLDTAFFPNCRARLSGCPPHRLHDSRRIRLVGIRDSAASSFNSPKAPLYSEKSFEQILRSIARSTRSKDNENLFRISLSRHWSRSETGVRIRTRCIRLRSKSSVKTHPKSPVSEKQSVPLSVVRGNLRRERMLLSVLANF